MGIREVCDGDLKG